MNHPMPDRCNVAVVTNHAMILGNENCQNILDGDLVIQDFAGHLDFVTVIAQVVQDGATHSDPFHRALRAHLHRLIGELDELIFDRRTTAIEDENPHPIRLPS